MKSFISIIIPVYNASATIDLCLRSLRDQDYPSGGYEIIVVDDGSQDDSVEIISRYSVRLFRQEHKGPAAARNAGLKEAKGELIIFLDADCVVGPDWIGLHVQAHRQREAEKIGCIGGEIKPYLKDANWVELCDYYSSWYAPPHTVDRKGYEYLPTTNLSIKRSIVEEAGGFNEALWCGEDIDLGIKLRRSGYTVLCEPAIGCYHQGRKTLKEYLYHHYHWGRFAPMFRKFGSRARYNFLFPPNTVLAVILAPLIAVAYTFYVVMKWFFQKPFLIVALSPAIFLSKIAYAYGCVQGTFHLTRQRT